MLVSRRKRSSPMTCALPVAPISFSAIANRARLPAGSSRLSGFAPDTNAFYEFGQAHLRSRLWPSNLTFKHMGQLQFNLQPERRVFLARAFTDIWVQGEISNCRAAQSGHIYCTLKDDRAQLKCVCFKSQLRLMKFRPEDGLHVTARGSISVYENR